MEFDPSKSIYGYSPEQYSQLLSIYTGDNVRYFNNITKNYIKLAKKVLMSAIIERNTICKYEHYIPGNEYSIDELKDFYKHYNYNYKYSQMTDDKEWFLTELNKVHMSFEQLYPLDPSFVSDIEEVKQKDENDPVIKKLCFMFGEINKEMLFKNHYNQKIVLESDISVDNIKNIIFTDTCPLKNKQETKIRILKQKNIKIEIDPFMSDPLILSYTNKYKIKNLYLDIELIDYIINNTFSKSDNRYSLLSYIPLGNLEDYIYNKNIKVNTNTFYDHKTNIINSLMEINGNFSYFDIDKLNTYSIEKLKDYANMYGITPLCINEELTKDIIVKNLELIPNIPCFYISSNRNSFLYGTREGSKKEFTLKELITSFERNKSFKHRDINFNYYAINNLNYLLGNFNSKESIELSTVINDVFESQTFTLENDIQFLKDINYQPKPVLKYLKNIAENLTIDKDIDKDLDKFMRKLKDLPTMISVVIARLPCVGLKSVTICDLYNNLASGERDDKYPQILINTYKEYIK